MRLPIKPFEKAGIVHNTIVCRVAYDKTKTGPILRMNAMEVSDGFEKCAIFGSPSASFLIESGWKTNNKKRLEAAEDLAAHQIDRKEGHVWDALQEFVKASGMELVA